MSKILEEYKVDRILDLTSEYYIFREEDKKYLRCYYNALVNDLMKATLHMNEVLEAVNTALLSGKESEIDLGEYLVRQQDYAVKTIAHMITLIDFAAWHSILVKNEGGGEAGKEDIEGEAGEEDIEGAGQEIVWEIADLFLNQLGEDFWEEVYDKLAIDIGGLIPACHQSYDANVENTIQSVRRDYPDFLSCHV